MGAVMHELVVFFPYQLLMTALCGTLKPIKNLGALSWSTATPKKKIS